MRRARVTKHEFVQSDECEVFPLLRVQTRMIALGRYYVARDQALEALANSSRQWRSGSELSA